MCPRARLVALFALLALFAFLSPVAPPAQAASSPSASVPGGDSLQFTSGGHVLGFQPIGVYVTRGANLLRLEFAGTAGAVPTAVSASGEESAQPLSPVTYSHLWDGITATFQPVPGGLYKSTYLVNPGAEPASIRLRYNVEAEIGSSGSLLLRLTNGQYEESAPVAWQEIDGARVPVKVSFQQPADREIGFDIGQYNSAYPLVIDPTLRWNTFLGSATEYDGGAAIVAGADGYLYVAGDSYAGWGSPIRPFTADYDTFVAKLDSSGNLIWNTFLGGTGQDTAAAIALDSSGNIYVTGSSRASWGQPVNSYADDDAFVAKLDSGGHLLWNTFMGETYSDYANAVATDTQGNVYVGGFSYGKWGTNNPRSYVASQEGWVAKLTGEGALVWNSFLGGTGFDLVTAIAVDSYEGNIFAAGSSDASWGLSPRRGFTPSLRDGFVAKLGSDGHLQWHMFLGGESYDDAQGIALGDSGQIYVTGTSNSTWETNPKRPYSGWADIFVTDLSSSGLLMWNTFLGGPASEYGKAIAFDGNGVYVAGDSDNTWGSPLNPHTTPSGQGDITVAKLSLSGNLQWNTFFGTAEWDYVRGITLGANDIAYITGESPSTWGSPLEPFHGTSYSDAFVAAIGRANSTTALSAHNPNPSFAGQAVTVSFTVAAESSSSYTPTGPVTVSDGVSYCTADLAIGHCNITFPSVGSRTLTASYEGDNEFLSSSGAATHQVNNQRYLYVPFVSR